MIAFGIFSLVLHFDGSLRPPRDPIPGMTRYTPKSLTMDKLASCSAAILSESGNDEKLHSMGGKMLDLMPGMTSADVEYEGLLMGLDKVKIYLSDNQNMASLMASSTDPALTVKGDCKVIVDQFQGKSIPRKMETKYNIAIEKMRSIQNLCAAYPQATKKLSVRFQHIPRDDNHLCDAICRLLVNQKQRSSVAFIHDLIKLGEAEIPVQSTRPIKIGSKKKKNLTSKNPYFQRALDSVTGDQLCHSSQLALSCELASAAIQQKDVIILSELADFFLLMSRRWGRIYYYEDTNSIEVKRALENVSASCKDLATQYSTRVGQEDNTGGTDDVFNMLQSLLKFFTDNNDMESRGGVESPFMDVSELVDEIDNEGWKEVQRWDLLASDAIKRDITTLESGVWLSPKVQSVNG
jgi:ribonuclease HI